MKACGKAPEQAEECQEDSAIPESPTSVSALMELLAEMRLSLDRCPFAEAIFYRKSGRPARCKSPVQEARFLSSLIIDDE